MQIAPLSMTNQHGINRSNFRKQNVSNTTFGGNKLTFINHEVNTDSVNKFITEANKVLPVAVKKREYMLSTEIQKLLTEDFDRISNISFMKNCVLLKVLSSFVGVTIDELYHKQLATAEEFEQNGIIVTDVDENDGLFTMKELSGRKIDAGTKSVKVWEFLYKHSHQIKHVDEDVKLWSRRGLNLCNLKTIGGNCELIGCHGLDISNLLSIEGKLHLSLCNAVNAKNLLYAKLGGEIISCDLVNMNKSYIWRTIILG